VIVLNYRIAEARPILYTTYEKVVNAQLIIACEVIQVEPQVAVIVRPLEILKGNYRPAQLRLAYKAGWNKTVESAGVSMVAGTERILFLKESPEGGYDLFAGSQGSISDDGHRQRDAIKQLVAVDAAQDLEAKVKILSTMLKNAARGRALALEALMRIEISAGDEEFNANVVACLEDPNFEVRRDAAYVAGKFQIQSAKPLLLKKARAEHPAVQSAAAAAVRDIDSKRNKD
jgi:hypothetical protein